MNTGFLIDQPQDYLQSNLQTTPDVHQQLALCGRHWVLQPKRAFKRLVNLLHPSKHQPTAKVVQSFEYLGHNCNQSAGGGFGGCQI
jgi:hypothetical protein